MALAVGSFGPTSGLAVRPAQAEHKKKLPHVLHFPNRLCLGGDFGVGQFLKPPALWSGRERIGVNGSEGGGPTYKAYSRTMLRKRPRGACRLLDVMQRLLSPSSLAAAVSSPNASSSNAERACAQRPISGCTHIRHGSTAEHSM